MKRTKETNQPKSNVIYSLQKPSKVSAIKMLFFIFVLLFTGLVYNNFVLVREMCSGKVEPIVTYEKIERNLQDTSNLKEVKIDIEVSLPNYEINEEMRDYGFAESFWNEIHLGSVLDFSKLEQTLDFDKLHSKIESSILQEILVFDFNSTLENDNEKLIKLTQFTIDEELEDYLINLRYNYLLDQQINNKEFYLGLELSANINDERVREAEYRHFNLKYQTGLPRKEIPMCLFIHSYQLARKRNFEDIMQSIEQQNYTNYKVVFVDDASPDNTAYKLHSFLKDKPWKLKNRIQIIRNSKRMGENANAYFYPKKYCSQESIVVNIEEEDFLVGYQTLKVLNSLYENENVWYIYSNHIQEDEDSFNLKVGPSGEIEETNFNTYRKSDDWSTAHLRTFRNALNNLIPISHSLYFVYNPLTKTASPRFYSNDEGRFQTYPLLEISGKDRTLYVSEFLYVSRNKNLREPCSQPLMRFEENICKAKTSFQRAESLSDGAKIVNSESIPEALIAKVKRSFLDYQECLAEIEGEQIKKEL